MGNNNIVKEIANEKELAELLKLEKAIVWIWVAWSGYAHQSRAVILQ